MSSILLGDQDRLPLARAVDHLGSAARRAGRPGWIWIAGIAYPGLNLNVDLVRSMAAIGEGAAGIEIPGASGAGSILALFGPQHLADLVRHADLQRSFLLFLLALPFLLILPRIVVGLAKISDPSIWKTDADGTAHIVESGLIDPAQLARSRQLRLRTAWRAGKHLGLKALGIWAMLLGLLVSAALVLVGPVVILVQRVLQSEELSPLVAGLLVPPLILLLVYAVVLMVINQLAMHSLAHNRRGVGSALTHAWRLVRAAPMSALRATLVDLVLAGSIFGLSLVIGQLLSAFDNFGVGSWISATVALPLVAFAGVTRAGYWARAYRALGGMSSADHVPGL